MSEVKIMLSANFAELENGQTYYARVYTVNPKGYMQSEVGTQIGSATPQSFPVEPTFYTLIDTYTVSKAWSAPEDGWFKIEVFGASGNGGSPAYRYEEENEVTGKNEYYYSSAGGGGGGGYGCSIVKMNAGDIVNIVPGAVGATTSAAFGSSLETYSSISVTSGGNGRTPGKYPYNAYGGAGGVASGGNYSNANGGTGGTGPNASNGGRWSDVDKRFEGGASGTPAVPGGNYGGSGAGAINGAYYNSSGYQIAATPGKAGFIKISRGNTNIAV